MKKTGQRFRRKEKQKKRHIEEHGIDMRGVIVEPKKGRSLIKIKKRRILKPDRFGTRDVIIEPKKHLVDIEVEETKDGTKCTPIYVDITAKRRKPINKNF